MQHRSSPCGAAEEEATGKRRIRGDRLRSEAAQNVETLGDLAGWHVGSAGCVPGGQQVGADLICPFALDDAEFDAECELDAREQSN